MLEVKRQSANFHVTQRSVNYNGELFIKLLCDLFNEVAEEQTVVYHLDVYTLLDKGQSWMLHQMNMVVNKMPALGQHITIETWPCGVEGIFALRDYRVLDDEGAVLLQASSRWMLVDMNLRKPMRMTPDVYTMRDAAALPSQQLEHLIDRNQKVEIDSHRHFVATFDNIDFNGHVTQSSYLSWMVNSLPFSFLKKHTLVHVDIIYMHEIMPEAEIVVGYRTESSREMVTDMLHKITSVDGNIVHGIAKSIWKSL